MSHSHDESRVPCFVRLCPNGCVWLGFGVTTVHLLPSEFRAFLRAALKAAEDLGISRPLEDAVKASRRH